MRPQKFRNKWYLLDCFMLVVLVSSSGVWTVESGSGVTEEFIDGEDVDG